MAPYHQHDPEVHYLSLLLDLILKRYISGRDGNQLLSSDRMGSFLSVLLLAPVELRAMIWRNVTRLAGTVVRRRHKPRDQTASHIHEYQRSLPHLPVPPLDQTAARFLESVRPLVNHEQFKHAENLVADFLQPESVSHKLQKVLEQRAAHTNNWLSDWWINVAYLQCRDPLMINVSPGVLYPRQDFTGLEGQIKTTAKAIAGVLDYKRMMDDHSLPPDKLGGHPLCMHQQYWILNTSRIPGVPADTVSNFSSEHPQHVTVIRNNHFFSVQVFDDSGEPLSNLQLEAQLRQIVEQSTSEAPPVGILTATHRDNWANTYNKLLTDSKNAEHVRKIQRSIAVFCLDGPSTEDCDNPMTLSLRQAICGDGSNQNSANRWFDKTLQVLIGQDGTFGATYEHSTAEGSLVGNIMDHVIINFVQKESPTPQDSECVQVPVPNRLDFHLTPEILNDISNAQTEVDSLVGNLDMVYFHFKDFGKSFIKGQKLSPDAFIQVAYQLAYYKLYGRPTATYESGSLRSFLEGRTETIRSCTAASLEYCKAMSGSTATSFERVEALRNAIQAHRSYTSAAVSGQGIDRHFLGLKQVAIENGYDIPDLFKDPVFTCSSYWQLSTSQVTSKAGGFMSFGPVVPDGFGICYNPMKDSIRLAISSWRSCPTTSAAELADSIGEALRDARNVLIEETC